MALFQNCVFLFLLFVFLTYNIECMVVIPERANFSYLNPKYLASGTINVRRYSRKSPYYINLNGTNIHTWTNNITVEIIILQFLNNEYRRSFLEMRHKFCDLVNNEPYLGGTLKNAGLKCPLPAGQHYISNMTAPTEHFPNVFPFAKGRADVTLSITSTGEQVMQVTVEASFKQKLGRK